MDTKDFRKKFRMSQRRFANFFGVPYGTVKNWDARDCAPAYFINLCFRFMALLGGGNDDKAEDSG